MRVSWTPRLESLAHSAENVLGKFRDGELNVNAEAVSLILGSIDRIKELMAHLEANETEPDGDDQDLIQQLNAMAEGKSPSEAAPAAVASAPAEDAGGGGGFPCCRRITC